jgi:ribosomal protein L11 methyltransferase
MITSGILAGKEDMVAQAMKDCGMEIIDISSQGEWKSVTGRRR